MPLCRYSIQKTRPCLYTQVSPAAKKKDRIETKLRVQETMYIFEARAEEKTIHCFWFWIWMEWNEMEHILFKHLMRANVMDNEEAYQNKNHCLVSNFLNKLKSPTCFARRKVWQISTMIPNLWRLVIFCGLSLAHSNQLTVIYVQQISFSYS